MFRIGLSLLMLALLTADASAGAGKRKPKITIGKDTTYLTAPLDADGYVDYPAALNQLLSKGVTPENNANVLLWQAIGPHPEGGPAMPAEFFKWLGVASPPEKGDYFVGIAQFVKDPDKDARFRKEIDRVVNRPWNAKECPLAAAWLEANAKPLALVVAATERPRYFAPLVPGRMKEGGSAGLVTARVPGPAMSRAFATALAARAMLAVGEQRPNDAWRDLLACHRLGRLTARGGTLIESLVGCAIDQVANTADLAYLDGAKLDARTILRQGRALQSLPPLPGIAEQLDVTERFTFLEIVTLLQRHGPRYLASVSGGKPPEFLASAALTGINWNPTLRSANRWFDRLAAAVRTSDRVQREKLLYQLAVERMALMQTPVNKTDLLRVVVGLGTAADVRNKATGDILLALLTPALRKVQQAAERAEQTERNRSVAFALAAFRQAEGAYPKELSALVPTYLSAVPLDLFSGKELYYHAAGNGYRLYSVGVNGRNEEGRSYEDDPPGDDLVIRMPLPALPR